jgi:hypothetical protein
MVAMRGVYLLVAMVVCAVRPTMAAMSSQMIAEMRQITSVSVSPDGRLAAVGICHPNTRSNKQELSWVIVPLHGNGVPKSVPAGEVIFDPGSPGTFLTRQALWSRDGRWFFYLRRDGEEVQLWETRSDGKVTRQVTHAAADVIDLKRSSNPDEFIVDLAPDRAALRKAEEDEYRSGILYDDHIIGSLPLTHTLPVIDRWRSVRWHSKAGTDTGEFAPLGWTGRTSLVFDVPLRKLRVDTRNIPNPLTVSESGPNRAAVVALSQIPKDAHDYAGKFSIQLERKTEKSAIQRCDIAQCIANRVTIIGWNPDGEEIYYLADSLSDTLDSGSPKSATVYAWNPRHNAVRLIHDSGREGIWGRLYNLAEPGKLLLEPSPIVNREMVVAFAGADQPPRLEAIDLDTGDSRILFDPNAELRSFTARRAVEHRWETSMGYAGRGIMVLPDDYHSGETFPAVITGYACGNGFLQGGSGDNAPEFVLAHQGFIAVCIDARLGEILAREADASRIYLIYCDMVSGLIANLTQEGKLDSSRVGLSGQSFGANAGTHCIAHSDEIAAAAFRHGSTPERERWELFETGSWQRGPNGVYARMGLPDPRNDPKGRWNEMSAAQRARDINTPTLIQTDVAGGYLGALPFWSALRDADKAIEMYVFPEDTHFLTQPIHTLVNFERQLDWFKFWLKHEEDMAPSKRSQYERWNQLREQRRRSLSSH